MPRRRRDSTAGLIFHVLNRGAKKSLLFETAADYAAFERVLSAAVGRFDVALFAYCLMRNHWHLLISPKSDGALSRCMHWLTTTHVRRWQAARGIEGEGAVYQGRFKAIPIGCDHHFLWVCRYVERNPVRANLVQMAQEWRWSSLYRRNTSDAGWLVEWPVARPADWATHVNQPQTEAELEAFRHRVARDKPFGEESWGEHLLEEMGRSPSRRRGRPRKAGREVSSRNDPRPPFQRFV
jgi:putative transposase